MEHDDNEPNDDRKALEVKPDLSNEAKFNEDKDVEMENAENFPQFSSNTSEDDSSFIKRSFARTQRRTSYGNTYPCKYCSNSYRELASFHSHMRTAHPVELNSENKFPCQFNGCDKVLPTALGKKLHEASHKKKLITNEKVSNSPPANGPSVKNRRFILPPKRYSESYGDFSGNIGLPVTMKKEESSNPKNSCLKCGKFFMNQYYLNAHNDKYHKPKKHNYCVKCGQVFMDREECDQHENKCIELSKVITAPNITDNAAGLIDAKERITTVKKVKTENMEEFPIFPICSSTPLKQENKPVGQSFAKMEETLKKVPFNTEASHWYRPTLPGTTGNMAPPSSSTSVASQTVFGNEFNRQISSRTSGNIVIDPTSEMILENVEKSTLPLSVAIFSHSKENPKVMMLVWSKTLEDDLLALASHNKNNIILCIQDVDYCVMTTQQKNILNTGQRINFVAMDDPGTCSIWTAITFGNPISLFGLKNRSFKIILDVEKVFAEYTGSQGMDLVNFMRYSDDGFHVNLSQNLSKKIFIFNCSE